MKANIAGGGVGFHPGAIVFDGGDVTALPTDRRAGQSNWTLPRLFDFFPSLAARRSRMAHLGIELSGGEQQMLAIGRALMTNVLMKLADRHVAIEKGHVV